MKTHLARVNNTSLPSIDSTENVNAYLHSIDSSLTTTISLWNQLTGEIFGNSDGKNSRKNPIVAKEKSV